MREESEIEKLREERSEAEEQVRKLIQGTANYFNSRGLSFDIELSKVEITGIDDKFTRFQFNADIKLGL